MLRRSLLLLLLLAGVGSASAWWYRITRPEYRFHCGREAIRKGDWQTAEAWATRLEASGAANLAHLLRGEALLTQEEPAAALRELNKVRDEGDLRRKAACLSGRCLLALGLRREAHRAFSFVLEQDNDDVDAHRGMAAVAYDLGNLGPALDHLAQVTRLAPRDGRPHRLMGLINTYLGQDPTAEEEYGKALECNLSDDHRSQVCLELAECRMRQTRYEEALAALDHRGAIEGREDLASLSVRAECLYNLNRRQEVEALLEGALAEHSDAWQLLLVSGQMDLDSQRISRAVERLERAVARASGEYRCHFQLAKAYTAAGRTAAAAEQNRLADKAQDDLKRMHDLSHEAMKNPWDPKVRLKLAELSEEVGNDKLAAMWRQAAQACRTEDE
jgi:tetratricopeptide (TPR) repeat protein